MTTHISARLAWHENGWNGKICDNPAANTFCIGPYSYPGTKIVDERNLGWEEEQCGKECASLDACPPCCFSINCFGQEQFQAKHDPPTWFRDGSLPRKWELPPNTVCLWPYEEMYREEVRASAGGYDWSKRLAAERAYFKEIQPGKSLVIYYTNYSNPFSEEDRRQYVIVGISRVKSLGEEMLYENCSDRVLERYGGMVWARNLTSAYPDEGLRLPYHIYRDQPDVINKILLTPDNPRNFKYATRQISDDDALDIVERFLETVAILQSIGDTSENWTERSSWLQSLIAELWDARGLYPGMVKVLDYLGFRQAIKPFKDQVAIGKETESLNEVFEFLEGKRESTLGLSLTASEKQQVQRQWRLREESQRKLLAEVLPRFDLKVDQISCIVEDNREDCCIYSNLKEMNENPYVICEEYAGEGPDDVISFNKIDHGMFPSPELGAEHLAEKDDPRRLRALCVERLKRQTSHTFVSSTQLIDEVNTKLSLLPEWKRQQFNERYLEVDEDFLGGALTIKANQGKRYVYLRRVFEAERLIEDALRSLASRADIAFKTPLTEKNWRSYLFEPESPLAAGPTAEEYEKAIAGQVSVCEKVFKRPICVISGEAGTGKTTVIKSLIQAIERTEGSGSTIMALAPTGKATDRIREKTGKSATTIHSFLVKHGWLNDNFTFKQRGGSRERDISTFIVDESSMLDLELTAALFRAVDWACVRRLIFVGDPNQLPPIGRGRVFADLIDWLGEEEPESVGVLQVNMRQMVNRLGGKGTGILDLASLYLRPTHTIGKDESVEANAEDLLRRIQVGGDIDQDLRVLYWHDFEELNNLLVETITTDIETDTGLKKDDEKPYLLWNAIFNNSERHVTPDRMQVISPYRGEQFGTEHPNSILQNEANGRMMNWVGHIDGVTLFDKVIQYRNRPKSNRIYAYNTNTHSAEKVEVYNGELGMVKPHAFDANKWQGRQVRRFQVVFARKDNYWVGYGKDLGKGGSESVEENLELAYAISVHKAQGSEFDRVYFVVPKHKTALLSLEMFYTGLTRASKHCTLLVEEDVMPLLSMRRPEKSYLIGINSSLFEFRPVPEELMRMSSWYEEGKIQRTLANIMVRSKSEVIIANMLTDRDITYYYEKPLFAPDGTFYLPDFTIKWAGEEWYWEHLGRLDKEGYRNHWDTKKTWFDKYFPGQLVTTTESGNLSKDAEHVIKEHFS